MVLSDNDANIIIVGSFTGTANFDVKNNTHPMLSAGDDDGFIAKYDTGLNFIYADKIGGAGDDAIDNVALNSEGFMVVTGTFSTGGCDFDPSGNTWIASGYGNQYNSFLGWYEVLNGALLTVDTFDNTTLLFSAITADNQGNVYATGGFSGSLDIDPGAVVTTITAVGNYDAELAAFNYEGALLWHDEVGGPQNEIPQVLKFDGTNLAWAMDFGGQVDFDPGPGIQTFTSLSTDAFVGRYDVNGNFQMGFATQSQSANAGTVAWDVYVTGNGYYVGGSYGGTTNFNPAGNNMLTTKGPRTGYLALYDYSGNFLQVSGFFNDSANSSSEIDRIVGFPGNELIQVMGTVSGEVSLDFVHPADSVYFPGNYQQFLNTYDFFAVPPDTAASNLVFSNVTDSSMTVSFTKGSGSKRLVLAHMGAPVDSVPTSGIYFTADTVFALGNEIGDSNFVVYNDVGDTFTLTGLDSQTVYYFAVFEYNGFSSTINYQTTNYLTGHQQTRPFPATGIAPVQTPNFTAYPNPVSNRLCLHFDEPLQPGLQINISDMMGQTIIAQIMGETGQSTALDVATLPAGVYLCRVTGNSLNQTIQFIKN